MRDSSSEVLSVLDFVEEKGFLSSDVILLLGTVTHD